MIHLTLTGFYAGTPLCGVDRKLAAKMDHSFSHAAYAPLHLPEYRAQVCPRCMACYLDTYEPGERKPSWATEFQLDAATVRESQLAMATALEAHALDATIHRDAERRKLADAMRDDFSLAGSDRPADNPNQSSLF